MIATLRALPATFPDRKAFIESLATRGLSAEVAAWLAQNLERDAEDRFRFGLDLDRIDALLDDYFRIDLWSAIDPPPEQTVVDLVIGGRSSVFGPDDRARAADLALAHPGRVRTHILENAGHWVHVDDPEGLQDIVHNAIGVSP